MHGVRYPQFCALARAAEVLGERWTLLIVRELLLGPRRFSDLRAQLDGISTSVLAERLVHLGEAGLVQRTTWEPPAAATVYELTGLGRALQPAVFELVRWGARLLLPRRADERLEPDWVRLALAACAARRATPPVAFQVFIEDGGKDLALHVAGGPNGTTVTQGQAPADATIRTTADTLLALMAGLIDPGDALPPKPLAIEGDHAALARFPDLFDVAAVVTDGGDRS